MQQTAFANNRIFLAVMALVVLSAMTSCRLFSIDQYLVFQPDTLPAEYSPTITTAAPTILVLSLTDNFSPQNLQPSPNETADGDWRVNGIAPQAVYHYSRAADELPKTSSGSYPIETRYWIYLELKNPLRSGKYYQITGPYGIVTIQYHDEKFRCESIKVNQVGYHPDSDIRYANLGVYLGTGGSRYFTDPISYHVKSADSGKVVYSGTAAYRGYDIETASNEVTSGEHVYQLDLSSVPAGGPYIIKVDGFGISYPFEISYAAVAAIAETYTRGLYHQRCGIALSKQYTDFTRNICHTEVWDTRKEWSSSGNITVDLEAPSFSISGGYHDAADFDRRPYHTMIPILMLSYYEAFPDHFTDSQYTIPESGNGLPDFLDEALWGLKIWKELQILDEQDSLYGGIRAGTETNGHPEYGKVNAADDSLNYGTWNVTPEVTASGAGMMAQAARLLSSFQAWGEEAGQLFSQALLAWNYLRTHHDDESLPLTNADTAEMLYASLQLSLASDYFSLPEGYAAKEFSTRFEELAGTLLVDDGSWPHQYRPGNIDARIMTAHFISYLLSDEPENKDLSDSLERIIFDQAERGGYMGFDPDKIFYPHGVTRSYGWGAATAQGRYADVYAFAYRLETDPDRRQEYFSMLSQLGDYALGLNPLGVSYVTGLGSEQPQSPLHLDSYFTKYASDLKQNVPGIVLFGPTKERSSIPYQKVVSDTVYPVWEDLPLERRWADGWSLVNSNEFTVWETMIWNICLYGVLNKSV
jgi:endoglucanase